jgi:hypothetical protein
MDSAVPSALKTIQAHSALRVNISADKLSQTDFMLTPSELVDDRSRICKNGLPDNRFFKNLLSNL